MSDPSSRTALITGGSRGIGRALAAEFAADGFDLVLVARNRDRLERVASVLEDRYGVEVNTMAVDLAEPDAPEQIYNKMRASDRTIDALVNNAGIATYGPFADSDLDDERTQLRVNVEAPIALTRQFLPSMLEHDSGTIVTVASTVAVRPGPMMAGYHASKAALLSFSESLAGECRGTGVSVTAICPGPISTGIHDRSGRGSTWLERRFMYSPERVAAVAYESIQAGETVVVPGFRHKLIPAVSRVLPRWMRRRLGAWVTTPGVVPRK